MVGGQHAAEVGASLSVNYVPLDPVYPVIFIDCVHVKIRDGQVVNRPICDAFGVTVNGTSSACGPVSTAMARALGGTWRRARLSSV